MNDVIRLLSKHYGENWRNIESLTFYNTISSHADSINIDVEECDLHCEPVEENESFV